MTATQQQIAEQLEVHGIEFGRKYTDPASGFTGEVSAFYFYKHGCMRVELRGWNKSTGEPASYVFDAPELRSADTGEAVPADQKRTGGPHDMAPVQR